MVDFFLTQPRYMGSTITLSSSLSTCSPTSLLLPCLGNQVLARAGRCKQRDRVWMQLFNAEASRHSGWIFGDLAVKIAYGRPSLPERKSDDGATVTIFSMCF